MPFMIQWFSECHMSTVSKQVCRCEYVCSIASEGLLRWGKGANNSWSLCAGCSSQALCFQQPRISARWNSDILILITITDVASKNTWDMQGSWIIPLLTLPLGQREAESELCASIQIQLWHMALLRSPIFVRVSGLASRDAVVRFINNRIHSWLTIFPSVHVFFFLQGLTNAYLRSGNIRQDEYILSVSSCNHLELFDTLYEKAQFVDSKEKRDLTNYRSYLKSSDCADETATPQWRPIGRLRTAWAM